MYETNLSAADVAAVTRCNDGYNNGNGMFGNDWAWIIILLLFGWGRNGFGNGFGGPNAGAPCATQADVREAVDQQTLISKLDQQTYGLADTFTALNNSINGNFRTLDGAICNIGYQNLQNTNAIQSQLASCCCDVRGDIKDNTTQGVMNTNSLSKQISDCCCTAEKMNMQNRFDAQAYNCNTLQAIDKLGDRIIDYMVGEKTQALRDENFALRLAASQEKQSRDLINEIRPCPIPSYQTCNPWAASWGFGFNNNCGCGCGNGNF